MSGPVDVLAVLDEAQDWLYRSSESRGDDERAEAVKQARAAVAELIESLCKIEQAATLGIRYHSTGPGYTEEISRIAKAALSNITGAKS